MLAWGAHLWLPPPVRSPSPQEALAFPWVCDWGKLPCHPESVFSSAKQVKWCLSPAITGSLLSLKPMGAAWWGIFKMQMAGPQPWKQ